MESSDSKIGVWEPVQCKLEPVDPSEPVLDSISPPEYDITVKIEPIEEPEPFEEISIKQEIVEEDAPPSPTVPPLDSLTRSDPIQDVKPVFVSPAPAPSDNKECVGVQTTHSQRQPQQKKHDDSNQSFHCDKCDHTFSSSASLKRHNRVHTTRVAYICDNCQQTFPSKAYLIKHKSNSCKYDDNLTCQYCGQQFLLENRLQSHLKKHTDERPYQCEVCSQKFKWKCTLERHMKLHEEMDSGKPFACKVCGKRFTQAGLIKPHMRTHTGERPFQCPICLKAFSHKHNMNKHQLRHNRVKHLVCEICHKQFPRESRLKYHMRVHWPDPKPFKCDHCTKTFSHRHNVTRHYQRKHPHAVYTRPETDASVATAVWKTTVAQIKPPEYILPQ